MNPIKRILVCPLDWGMGHATRMIPVIDYLMREGLVVQVAAGINTLSILKKQFPEIKAYRLPTISPRYSKKSFLLIPGLLWQTPKLIYKVWQEHKIARAIVLENKLDAVISDNRFGLWNLPVKSAYVSHQIHFKWKGVLCVLNPVFTGVHRFIINKYQHLFVPDFGGEQALASGLSHLGSIKTNADYIGHLSALDVPETLPAKDSYILILLSGQEPQRSILEKELLKQVRGIAQKVILIRGTKEMAPVVHSFPKNVQVVNFVQAKELSGLLAYADFVIARSGYSTMMDLVHLNKKALLIPTPGQVEQEYLAAIAYQKGWFYSQNQNEINIRSALNQVIKFRPPQAKPNELHKILDWINKK